VYVVNEGVGMEARRSELISEVRALDLRCRDAGEHVLSAALTRLGDELEAMSHGELRRRCTRIAHALAVVRTLLPPLFALRRERAASPDGRRREH